MRGPGQNPGIPGQINGSCLQSNGSAEGIALLLVLNDTKSSLYRPTSALLRQEEQTQESVVPEAGLFCSKTATEGRKNVREEGRQSRTVCLRQSVPVCQSTRYPPSSLLWHVTDEANVQRASVLAPNFMGWHWA